MSSEAIGILLSMGFNETQSLDALTECSGDVERAIDFLLGAGVTAFDSDNNASGATAETSIVNSEISQYTNSAMGRSACTSIALTLACSALSKLQKCCSNIENTITSSLLSDSIKQGLQMYNELQKNDNFNVEHLSVEDILRLPIPRSTFSSLHLLPNSPRQGILSSSSDNPIGLHYILSACQSDANNDQSYIAVIITKPPETVLVLLPASNVPSEQNYVLLDSHPRPNQFPPHYPTGSFALFHSSLHSLVRSLEEIFPVVDLGSDVNEMMAMMYNSFDVYPFQLNG